MLFHDMQDAVNVKILIFDWLEESVRVKDEWRSATMEYGGQCVTMAGIKWMLMLSANNWATAAILVREYGYVQKISNLVSFLSLAIAIPLMKSGVGAGPVLLNNVSCTQSSTEISQCVHPLSIGIHHCNKSHTAGVKCQKIIVNPSTVQSIATR